MITGADTVLMTAAAPRLAVRAFLDRWSARWPDMRVLVTGHDESGFAEWARARDVLPTARGNVLVARDAAMVEAWDEFGYELPDSAEGPFTVMYEPCPARTFHVTANEDPYARGMQFDPYEAVVVGAKLTLVTVVTPDLDGTFSREVIDSVITALADV